MWKDGLRALDKGRRPPVQFHPRSISRPTSLTDLNSTDVPSITRSIINHVQTSLSRQAYNLDDLGAYQAAALSAKDNMLVRSINFHRNEQLLTLHS